MLLPLSKYLHPIYPTHPTSIHLGFNLLRLIDDTGIGFLLAAFLVRDE